MKTLLIILSLCVSSAVFSQNPDKVLNKTFFDNDNPDVGGDVIIKTRSYWVVGEEIHTIFEIESPEDNVYYMDAWILVPLDGEGHPVIYKVAVNDLLSEYTLKPPTGSWQSLALTDAKGSAATVKLGKGDNSISIIGKGPAVPMVEFIKLSLDPLNTGISDKKYKEFVEQIISNTLFASVNNQEILLNLYSENEERALVKIYNIFGRLEYESSYNLPKGGQTVRIDASNFQKGISVIQITIGSKTTSRKINI